MILPALTDYYDRLDKDPKQDVAPFGFSREKISYCVVLSPKGEFERIESLIVEEELPARRKGAPPTIVRRPRLEVVPDRGGRSGTLIKPNFLWDNTGYALGRDNKGNDARAEECFAAFRDLHREMAKRVDDPGLIALNRFLDSWSPDWAESLEDWEELAGLNVVFRVRSRDRDSFVHESPALQRVWASFHEGEIESEPGFSLTTGQRSRLGIARLHPMLKGVVGAQSSGAALASFNLDAFESYDKSQSYNAPVSVEDAFKYTTALNRLLADRSRKARIGDATVVFWSGKPAPFERMFGGLMHDSHPSDAEEDELVSELKGFLGAVRMGRAHEGIGDPDTPFYVLGLSPNASRLSVRFWCASTVGELADRLARHVGDLEMVGRRDGDRLLFISRIVRETARESKDISPQLAGEVARAVLTGAPYPASLLSSILRRIRADQSMNHARAAVLKAYLIRNLNQEVPVSLNKDHPSPAYHMGRLFAAIEKTQEDALGGKLNRTVRDSYFGSASATPASVFPRLLRLHQHHLDKIENTGQRITRDKLMQEIITHVARFPAFLPLADQGLFQIGYYHQRQDFFTKKETTTEPQEVTA